MNISSGISAIHTSALNTTAGKAKVYLWPVYNAGKIVKTAPVSRQVHPEYIYKKPEPEEFNRLLSQAQHSNEIEYTASGKTAYKTAPILPGSLFEARV